MSRDGIHEAANLAVGGYPRFAGGIRAAVKATLGQVIEEERARHVGGGRHRERTEGRSGDRNGTYGRGLITPGFRTRRLELSYSSCTRVSDIHVLLFLSHAEGLMVLAKQRNQSLLTVGNYSWNPMGIRREVHRAITQDRLKDAVNEYNVKIIDMGAAEFYRTYDGPPPALFFCDADHSYEAVRTDLEWARSVGASIICGDDYEPDFQPGVVRAVDELGGVARLSGGLFVLKQ